MPAKQFFVYTMTNGPKSAVLYTGITGDLVRRVWQHKNKLAPGFTSRYNLTQLVYYEQFVYPDAAIRREKEIKGWRRSKKIALIDSMSPSWEDLARDWQSLHKPATDSASAGRSLAPLEKARGFGMTPSKMMPTAKMLLGRTELRDRVAAALHDCL
jgi:putative endonuclease